MADKNSGISNEQSYICIGCGAAYPKARHPPETCRICRDERQYVGWEGQRWTTLPQLRRAHRNTIQEEEPGLYSIHTAPGFAIGQRAFLLQTRAGNILWDCISLIDEETIAALTKLGGVAEIAISHPHYYATMIEWSLAFDNAPIRLHCADRSWVMHPHRNLDFWAGETKNIVDDLVLVHTPGHFDGYQVLHWPSGAAGTGVLLAGDQPQVCPDVNWVSFMYSYPNYIPLGPKAVTEILGRLNPFDFDRMYGAFPQRTVRSHAKQILRRSSKRFLRAIDCTH